MKAITAISLLLAVFACTLDVNEASARKYKYSLSVDKESKRKKAKPENIPGVMVNLSDTLDLENSDLPEMAELRKVNFAGYDKEPNSSTESFLLVNPSGQNLTGFEVRIDYLDMQGRMLHSRTVKQACFVPAGETRRFDLKSWDVQHTYYYYLGNEPKRVATPFQVVFHPVSLWLEYGE